MPPKKIGAGQQTLLTVYYNTTFKLIIYDSCVGFINFSYCFIQPIYCFYYIRNCQVITNIIIENSIWTIFIAVALGSAPSL